MRISLKAFFVSLVLVFSMNLANAQDGEPDLENTLYLDLEYGRVEIRMFPELAPNHVEKIKKLTREGFYDGSLFHRVIDGFMAQTGAPKGERTGGSGTTIDAEFSESTHIRGIVSMARPTDVNGADSQFFIMTAYRPHLDGEYTVWGVVVSGMRYVDKIKIGEGEGFEDPDMIIKMQVAADVEE